MESRALEIEKRRRRQPLAELERKHLKALRRKGRLFTTEHLDYAFVWAEDLAQILTEAAERNAAAISPETFERTALREAPPNLFSHAADLKYTQSAAPLGGLSARKYC